MAKRKSTRGTRVSRNPRSEARTRRDSVRDIGAALSPVTTPRTVDPDSAIEAARTTLMRARAVLDCTRYVLLYEDQLEGDPRRPSFSDAVGVARDLVDHVIDALDRVNLRAARK